MRPLLLGTALLLAASTPAQHWRPLGLGPVHGEVQTLYGDSVSDRLLAGGTFARISNNEDTVLGIGQAAWNGQRWDSLAHRIQFHEGSTIAMPTYWYLRFQGELYACGAFGLPLAQGGVSRSFARLNEQTQRWEDLGCINPTSYLSTLVPKEPQGQLYATGHESSLCGYPAANVYRYDGSSFHPWEPFQLIPWAEWTTVGFVFDFQGKTYMTGLFRDPLTEGYATMMRYNGQAWEYVPGWNAALPLKDLSIRNDTLYVAGGFRMATGGPGNLVAFFDGQQWNNMGGGLAYPPATSSAAALDLQWFRGELYACGLFQQAGGVPVDGIAKWDGQRWCGLPGDFHSQNFSNSTLRSMAVWRDSLYVAGGFQFVDGVPMREVVQWIGGDALGTCSAPVGVQAVVEERFHAGPVPAHSELRLYHPPAEAQRWSIRDAHGRICASGNLRHSAVPVEQLTPGMYLLLLHNAQGRPLVHTRFVKQ